MPARPERLPPAALLPMDRWPRAPALVSWRAMGTRAPGRARLVVRIAVCAAVGPAATVAMAWLHLSAWNGRMFAPSVQAPWPEWAPADWPRPPDGRLTERPLGARIDWWVCTSGESRGRGKWEAWSFRCGWPFKALACRGLLDDRNGSDYRWSGALKRPAWFPGLVYWMPLPVVPLPGLAADTALFGGALFLVWSAPGVLRRRHRLARGWCVACGYDLKGTAGPCPECGV